MKVTKLLTSLAAVLSVSGNPVDSQQADVEDGDKFFRINFNVHRGDNVLNQGPGKRAEIVKRDDFTMELTNAQTFYLTELKLGSEDEKVQVLVDTGSSDLWVMEHDVFCFAVSQSTSSKERLYVGDVHPKPLPGDSEKTPSKSVPVEEDLLSGQNKDFGDILSALGIDGTDVPSSPDGGGSGGSGGSGSESGPSTNTCTSYGSFATDDSSSFQKNSSAPPFEIEYADGTTAEGVWGHDRVKIHNATINDLSFAVVNSTSSNIGVLGIGLPGLEVTYSSGSFNNYQYQNLPMKLKSEGIIGKIAYSLYLGHSDDETGTILFGAVDHAKYSGTLKTLPIVNSLESSNYRTPIRLEINLTGLKLSTSSDNTTVTDNGYSALLDTGSTLSYFPSDLLQKTAEMLDLDYSSSLGAFVIDCNTDDSVEIMFDFSGVIIKAPLSDFVLQAGRNTCYFGILPQGSSSNYILVGDNFLRNAYVVYDLEDLTISLAQAKFNTDDEDIQLIESDIPQAEAVSSAATKALTGGPVASGTGHVSSSGGDDSSNDNNNNEDAGYSLYPSMIIVVVGLMSTFLL